MATRKPSVLQVLHQSFTGSETTCKKKVRKKPSKQPRVSHYASRCRTKKILVISSLLNLDYSATVLQLTSAKQGVCRWAAERSSQEQPAQTGVTPSGHAQCQIGRDSSGKSGAFVTLTYVKCYIVTSYIYPPSFTFLFKSLSFMDWVPGKSHLSYCYLKQGYLQQVFTVKTI